MADKKPPKPQKPAPTKPYPGLTAISKRGEKAMPGKPRPKPPQRPKK